MGGARRIFASPKWAEFRGAPGRIRLKAAHGFTVVPMKATPSLRGAAAAALALTLLATVTSCTTTLTPAVSNSAPTPSPSASAEPAPPKPQFDLAPLRGTSVAAGSLAHASIAAKIDNHPDARPQVGLERTDIVFEELVEGGMTRYIGMWHSDIPDLLGPVRSIRPMDPEIISAFEGIIAYSGGQERFVNLMRQAPVYNAIHGQADTASTFFRGNQARAPHNVMVKAKELLAQHTDLRAPAQQFNFASTIPLASAPMEGSPQRVVSYRFSTAMAGSWTWDAGTTRYLREQGRGPDLDTNRAQLAATNVVVLRVAVTNGLGVPKTELIGTGEAWVSTGGSTVRATWTKASATSPIRLVSEGGFTTRLAAGNTWIEMIPLEGSVTFTP